MQDELNHLVYVHALVHLPDSTVYVYYLKHKIYSAYLPDTNIYMNKYNYIHKSTSLTGSDKVNNNSVTEYNRSN